MSDITSIAMEHQNSNILGELLIRWTDEKSAELLAVRSRDRQLVIVRNSKMTGSRNPLFSPSSYWYVAGVDELAISILAYKDYISRHLNVYTFA